MLTKSRLTLWMFCLVALLSPIFSLAQYARDDLPAGEVNGEYTTVIAWSPTGEYIATGNQGGFSLWDSQTGELIQRYPIIVPDHPEIAPLVTELVWNPNGSQIATRLQFPFVDRDRIQVLDIPSGDTVIDNIEAGQSRGLDWSPDGSTLAVLYSPYINGIIEIRFHNAVTGELMQTLPVSDRDSSDIVKWSPDGTKIAINYNANTYSQVIIWDYPALNQLNRIPHPSSVGDFDWNFDSEKIISRDSLQDSRARIWNVDTGELIRTIDLELPNNIEWSPTENVVAVESRNTIYLVDALSGNTLNQTTRFANFISWNPNGTALATVSGTTPLIYTRDGQELPQFPLMAVYNITNINTNQPITRIYDNEIIDLADLEDIESLVIQAFPNFASIQSATLELNGEITLFNERPYIVPLPSAGTYTLTGIPYTEPDAQGTQGTPLTITFTVIDEND